MSDIRIPAEFRDIPVCADEQPPRKKAYDPRRAEQKEKEANAARLWSVAFSDAYKLPHIESD